MDEIRKYVLTLQILLWIAIFVGVFNCTYMLYSVIRIEQYQAKIATLQGNK